MNRILLILCLVCFRIDVFAQKQTYYFKLDKIVRGGIPNTRVSGGQFITFIGDICFESNKKGFSVGNGTLRLNTNSGNDYKTYEGKCYWGNDAEFRFKKDLSILNVVTDNGEIYVYKRTATPSGVNTCSLIRKKEDSSGQKHSDNNKTTIVVEHHRDPIPVSEWVTCNICYGDGKCHTLNCSNGWNYSSRTFCIGCGGDAKCHYCNGKGGRYQTVYR